MKIAYLSSHPLNFNDGVVKKIVNQIDSWKNYGCEVIAFSTSKNNSCSIIENVKIYKVKSQFLNLFKLNKKLIDDINDFNPDIVYVRYDLWSMTYEKISRKYKCIIEVQTNDIEEYFAIFKSQKTLKSIFIYFFFKISRAFFFKKSYAIVTVTRELSMLNQYTKFKKPIKFFSNAIDFKKINIVKVSNNAQKTSLFFMGTPRNLWHGVDLLKKIAFQLPCYDFHIVGYDGKSTDNCFYHGYLKQHEYIEILKKCHICIGSLGLKRINMREGSPLKVREYLAMGYPVIINYKETAFLDLNKDFIFDIDDRDILSNSLKNDLIDFIENNKNRVVRRIEISEISSELVELKRLNFFKSILNIK